MAFVDLDIFSLTDEEKAIQETARKFSAEVLRPASIELDKLPSAEDVIADGSVLWEVFRKYRKLDFHKMMYPEEFGGLGLSGLASALVGEQLGWGSSDLAVSLGASGIPFFLAMLAPDPELQKLAVEYAEDEDAKLIGCWAITEPDHGSDWILAGSEEGSNPDVAPSVRAVLDGDEYVINGQKAAWVSNATIATHAALFVGLDPALGMHGTAVALIPLDMPGITKGKPLEKMAKRALNQGEIFFDDLRIPASYMVSTDPDVNAMVGERILAAANAGMGSLYTGVAQAAFDEAFAYARERIQGGKPIIEHQNIKLRLFDMFRRVEAARSLSRRAVVYNSLADMPAPQYSIAAKTFCTETAFKVASDAIQVLGGVGLTREYHVEKLFRDARAGMIEDGVNETLSLGGMDRLCE